MNFRKRGGEASEILAGEKIEKAQVQNPPELSIPQKWPRKSSGILAVQLPRSDCET